MPKPPKAPLMALRERLAGLLKSEPLAAAESKGILVPRQVVPDELYNNAARGDGLAVQALSSALGQPAPRNEEGLRRLLTEVEPSRRGFLRGLVGTGAQLIAPSPLKLLNSTAEALGPRLTAELTPMELMEYSKKHFDRPFDWHKLPGHDLITDFAWHAGNSGPDVPFNPTIREALTYPGQDTGFYKPVLEQMGLEPTQQNLDSMNALSGAIDTFHPDSIDAQWDDLKHSAQDFAAGEWADTDQLLNDIESDFGIYGEGMPELSIKGDTYTREVNRRSSEFQKNLNSFLNSLHKDSTNPIRQSTYDNPVNPDADSDRYSDYIGNRRWLDERVEDEAYGRGYMDDHEVNQMADDEATELMEVTLSGSSQKRDKYTEGLSDDYISRLKESKKVLKQAGYGFWADDVPENQQATIESWRESMDDGDHDELLEKFDELFKGKDPSFPMMGGDLINSLANYFRK